MKRTISLILCMVMILSLLTGMATGDTAEELTLQSEITTYADYFGSRGFALYLEDSEGNRTLVPNDSADYRVYFSNPLLGALEKTAPDRSWAEECPWTWASGNAVPGETGDIVVEHDGKVYRTAVSTGVPNVGFYTDAACEPDSLLTENNRDIVFAGGSEVSVYVKLNKENWKLTSLEAGILEEDDEGNETLVKRGFSTEIIDAATAKVTLNGFGGTGNMKIIAEYQTEDRSDSRELYAWLHGDDSDVIRVVWGNNEDRSIQRTNMTQFNGGWGLDILYCDPENPDAEPVHLTGDTAEVWFSNGGLGSIDPIDGDDACAWNYDHWTKKPNRSGYFVVSYQGKEYRLFVSTGYPDVGLYTTLECDPDSYLVKEPEPMVEYTPGESVTIYAYTTDYDSNPPFISEDSADPDLINIQEVDAGKKYAITFTAPEDADGAYYYRFPWAGVGLEVEFTAPDTNTLRIVDDAGNRRYYDSMTIPGHTGFCLQYLNEKQEWVNLHPGNGKVYLAAAGENGQLDLDNADKLGLLTEYNEHWEWNLRSADPYVKGYLCAEIPGYDEVFCAKISTGQLMQPVYAGETYLRPDSNGIIYYEYQTGEQIELHMDFAPQMAANYQNINLSYSKNHPGLQTKLDDDQGGVTITFDTTGLSGLYTMELNVDLTDPLEGNMDSHFWNLIRFVQTVSPPSMDIAEIPQYVNYTGGYFFAPIQVGEKTYYLAVAGVDHTEDNALTNPVKGDTMMWDNGTHWTPYAVMFYEDINGVAVRVPEDQLQVSLGMVEAVGLNIYAIRGLSAENGGAGETEMMPHVYKGDSHWLASRVYNFTHDSAGDYLLVASAVVNGQNYYAYSPIHMMKMTTDLKLASSVEEANQIMADYGTNSFTDTLILSFEGVHELYGTITVPAGLNVTLHGDSREGTALFGGVCSDSGGFVENFTFIGAGKNQQIWPENPNGVAPGTKNYALYGRHPMAAGYCTFMGYDTAVYIGADAPGCNFGGNNNSYMENHIGIYVDYYGYSGGQGSRENNKFVGNDYAIWLNHVEYMEMDFFRLRNAWFINNGVDIRNDTGRLYWLPMCYFLHTNDSVDLNNPGHHSDKQSNHWQPVTEPEAKNKHHAPAVIASPAAVDPFFKDLSYYYPKHIYVYPAMRSLYPIVDLEDEMMVTALDEAENVIATVMLKESGVQTQGLSLMADGPTDLDSPVDEPPVSEAAFDSTMIRKDEDGKVELTIAAIPEGYAATVDVPCDGWATATVLLNGEEVDNVSVADGVVTFEAAASGAATYTIIRDNYVSELKIDGEEAETIPVGEFQLSGTVKVEEVIGNAVVMVAGYTNEGKMVLSEIPVLQDGSFDLTVNNTGNLHNLKVFLLNSIEKLLPINGAQKIGKP